MMDYLPLLKEHQLKATPQRLAVLKVLEKHEHPTMDELYCTIKEEHPSISLATVYKNVNALKEAGVVAEVNMPNGKMRYDVFVEPHIHVVCKTCGKVQDMPYSKELENYQIHLEKSLGNLISHLDLVASVEKCHQCLEKE